MIGTLHEPAGVRQSGASEHAKFFYGWWIVAVAGIGPILVGFVIATSLAAVLMSPLGPYRFQPG